MPLEPIISKQNIDDKQKNSKHRRCGDRDKTVDYKIIIYSKHAQKE